MMKARFRWPGAIAALCCFVPAAAAQGDLAVYDTFSRYSPAVWSVSVEIPREYILQRYDDHIDRLKGYQEYFNELAAGKNEGMFNLNQFESVFDNMERRFELLKEQLLRNNRVRGAAFAVDSEHLVTLGTVVKSATLGGEVMVMNDLRQTLPAVLRGVDELTGVAVLKVTEGTLDRYVNLDYTGIELPVASYVMTIQRPYDLPASPISGMVGGYYRQLNLFRLEKYIQTDLPLYPGNEGAPVFSPSGQLVGMIAAEFRMGNWPGVTFVIPADYVAEAARELIERGYRDRGRFPGINLGMDDQGLMVTEVGSDSPYRGQVREGDLIVGLNGQSPKDLLSLHYDLVNVKPNEKVSLTILRGGRQMEVVLESRAKVVQ